MFGLGIGRLGAIARAINAAFSPSSLFSGGAPGVWYDPSDYSTLFQDSAGTVPVTAVEQPVGLMLDKSQGLVLGPEVIPQPLNLQSDWIASTATIGSATQFTTTGAGGVYLQLQANKYYLVESSGSSTTTVNMYRLNPGVSSALVASFNGRCVFSTTSTQTALWIRNDAAGITTVNSITVKELPGNHAFQSTSASRPVLSARYNLLTKTEDFSDVNWGVQGATKTTGVLAPDGTTTAVTIAITSNTGNNFFRLLAGLPSESRIATAMVKGTAGQQVFFAADDSAPQTLVTFTGDWQTVSNTQTASGNVYFVFEIFNRSGGAALSNVTFSVWHPDLRVANNGTTQPDYQRVNTATDYDTTGFLPYLKFDGVDDSLSTNSINFTSTDKMSVFAGVRKLSDAARGVVAELSSGTTNAGMFLLDAPNANLQNYSFASKGNGDISVAQTGTGTFIAPITNVLSGIGNISGDSVIMRANGAQVAQSTADQGTGNYGNWPLFIGRRNNASFPFNGQLYSMIIVGKAVTAGELTNTETYVATKTGVTL